MNSWRLILQSLRYHAKSHIGVLLGATLATAIITGALAVGDSVRYSLQKMALSRIGIIENALYNPERFFRTKLASDLASELGVKTSAIILLPGTATAQRADGTGGDVRVNRVQVIGIESDFWELNANPMTPPSIRGESVALNERLAAALSIKIGDDVLLRVNKPSLLSRDAPLSTIEDATVTLRAPVGAILKEEQFGRFSLEANQTPPFNAFIAREALQKLIGMENRANALLTGVTRNAPSSVPGTQTSASANATSALWKHWDFTDSGLDVRKVPNQNLVELRTNRVFLDPPLGEAAIKAMPDAKGTLTYFVNELRVGQKATPYSTVAAMEGGIVPSGMKDDEILVNEWFAQDVGAKVGDQVALKYWLVGPMRKLEEHSSTFKIRGILPLAGVANDPTLMPDIPGLSDKKNCREWEPGVPVDLNKLRDKDQAYWDIYRGTPKAFITLRAGQNIWKNRFGNLTSVRYPARGNDGEQKVRACLRQALNPASQGLFFQPVRERALTASSESLDFGQLFLGFSFFLILAALLLTALLFAFGVEQRASEIGTLLALGFSSRRILAFLLMEGALIAILAALAGVALASLYARMVVGGLTSIWSGAVSNSSLEYHANSQTLIYGGLAGFLMALFAIYLAARRQTKASARELMASGSESAARLFSASRSSTRLLPGLLTALVTGVLALVLGIATPFLGVSDNHEAESGIFFGVGALALIAGISICRVLLSAGERRKGGALTMKSLAERNAFRRVGRSLGVISLLASGSFLVIAIGANRHDPGENATRRSSGTGGFALYAESSLPVYQDLNAPEGRDTYALDDTIITGAKVVSVRVREGDEASCLNLNRAQTPRLLGAPEKELADRGAFTFMQTQGTTTGNPWNLLKLQDSDGAIPVIGDTNAVTWSLGKKLGDTLDYADDRGVLHKLRIVGILAGSILQGGLILSESHFTRLFPGDSGYRVFLIDAPPERAKAIGAELTRKLSDVGMAVTPATDRLSAFQTVENAYLSIFAILGGLGLLLGSLGLGIVVLRNVYERSGELALLRAVGFRSSDLQTLVFREHALLLSMGLIVGTIAALIAVLPSLLSPGANIPYLSLSVTIGAVFLSGFLFAYLAARFALNAPLLNALRHE